MEKIDFYIFSVINPKTMASCRGLNCGYFGTKGKVIGQVEEELRILSSRWDLKSRDFSNLHFFFFLRGQNGAQNIN